MTTKANAAMGGLCFRPALPATSAHAKAGADFWMQICSSEKEDESVSFKELSETGKFVRDCMIVSFPQDVLSEMRKFHEGSVPEDGIEIVSTQKVLTDFGGSAPQEEFDPLGDVELWKNFTGVEKYSRKAHLLFKKYGFLLHENIDRVSWKGRQTEIVKKASAFGMHFFCYAEPIERWYIEFDRLHLAKDLWLIISNDEYELEKKTLLLGERIFKFFTQCGESLWVDSKDYLHLVSEDYEKLSMVEDINFYEKIKFASLDTHMYMLSILVSLGIGNIRVSLDINSNYKPRQRFIPSNLISAVWIQFADYMSEGSKLLVCNQCQQTFIRQRGQHKDKVYCGNACKQKAWRERSNL